MATQTQVQATPDYMRADNPGLPGLRVCKANLDQVGFVLRAASASPRIS